MPDDTRFFTLDEANRTLPLVARIVRDIVEAYPSLQRRIQEFHELSGAPDAASRGSAFEALRDQIDREAERINGFLHELHGIGCQFKGFEEGLVDFSSRLDGRTVLLCWKLGEERIAWWHEVDAGFAGRRPITPGMVFG